MQRTIQSCLKFSTANGTASMEKNHEVSDAELKKVIADFLEMGHIENIVSMFRQDPQYYMWSGDILKDERFNVRLGMTVLFEELKEMAVPDFQLENGFKTISQSDFDQIVDEFDINKLSTNSENKQDGPFCIIHLPIFSINKQFAIMKYEYIPFPREYSSGTFVFKKINGIWKPIGNVGVYVIS